MSKLIPKIFLKIKVESLVSLDYSLTATGSLLANYFYVLRLLRKKAAKLYLIYFTDDYLGILCEKKTVLPLGIPSRRQLKKNINTLVIFVFCSSPLATTVGPVRGGRSANSLHPSDTSHP